MPSHTRSWSAPGGRADDRNLNTMVAMYRRKVCHPTGHQTFCNHRAEEMQRGQARHQPRRAGRQQHANAPRRGEAPVLFTAFFAVLFAVLFAVFFAVLFV